MPPNKYRDYVKAHAGKGMSLTQIAAKWQATKQTKPQRGGAGTKIYVAVIRSEEITEVIIISNSKKKAMDAINNASSFPNWVPGADFGIVVETEMDTEFSDGLLNEHSVYQVEYSSDGNATQLKQQQQQQH